MGRAKAAMMEHEDDVAAAAHFLAELGTLSTCHIHGNLFDGDGDIEGAYKIAAYRHKRGQLSFGEGKSQLEVTDLIKEAYDDNAGMDVCGYCDHLMSKDD